MTRRLELTAEQAEFVAIAVTKVLREQRIALATIMDERYARRGRGKPDVASWKQAEANALIRQISALQDVINLLDDPNSSPDPSTPG